MKICDKCHWTIEQLIGKYRYRGTILYSEYTSLLKTSPGEHWLIGNLQGQRKILQEVTNELEKLIQNNPRGGFVR